MRGSLADGIHGVDKFMRKTVPYPTVPTSVVHWLSDTFERISLVLFGAGVRVTLSSANSATEVASLVAAI